jgi:hypothetical protein
MHNDEANKAAKRANEARQIPLPTLCKEVESCRVGQSVMVIMVTETLTFDACCLPACEK